MGLGLVGCLVLPVPTPHGRVLEGREVQAADIAFVRPGETSRSEVVRQFGQPSVYWRDENTLIYRWVQREGILFWAVAGATTGGAGAMDLTAEFAYLVRCDAADRVVATETIRIRRSPSFGEQLLRWRDARRSGVGVGEGGP